MVHDDNAAESKGILEDQQRTEGVLDASTGDADDRHLTFAKAKVLLGDQTRVCTGDDTCCRVPGKTLEEFQVRQGAIVVGGIGPVQLSSVTFQREGARNKLRSGRRDPYIFLRMRS